jgi:hypothetical protein
LVIAVLLFWLTLIAVWGVSECWDTALMRRRVGRGLRAVRHPHAAHPFDSDDL